MKHTNRLALEGGPKTIYEPLPFAGFGAELIGEEEERHVLDALRSRKLCRIAHPFEDSPAHRLEQAIRQRFDVPFSVALNSCASALHVALVAIGIGPGDEVLVSGAGWFSVASAAINLGAVPVPVEYREDLTIDVDDLETKLTDRTRALIVIHWRGLPPDMERLMAIARRHSLRVVEDVAQSFGASYRGRALGTIGDVGCYSFNTHKIICGGEGGALVTKEPAIYKRAMSFSGMYNMYLRLYDDGERRSMPQLPMLNFRIPELCAAMTLAQLGRLDEILGTLRARSRELVAGIEALGTLNLATRHDPLGDCGYTVPVVFPDAEQASFFFEAMRAEGAGNVSNASYGFGGGEARGTAQLVASEGLDSSESGQMAIAHTWRCVTERTGPTPKLNAWKLGYGEGSRPSAEHEALGIMRQTRDRLSRVVAFKTNVLLEQRHVEGVLRATEKVTRVMQQRYSR